MLSNLEYSILKIVADKSNDIYTKLELKDIVLTASRHPECDVVTTLHKLDKQGLITIFEADKYGVFNVTITYEGQSVSLHHWHDVVFEILGHLIFPIVAAAFFSALFAWLFK